MITKVSILNGSKYFSSGIFQNYLVFIPAKKYIIYFSVTTRIESWKSNGMSEENIENIAKLDEEIKTIPINFNEKKVTCKTQNFYILLAFLLITIAFLIAVSIYCHLMKYQSKQKHLLRGSILKMYYKNE